MRAIALKHEKVYHLLRSLRMLMLRKLKGLRTVDKTFMMGGNSYIGPNFTAAAYSYVGPGCYIGPNVSLGAYSMLAPSVAVVGGDHRFDIPGSPMIFAGRAEIPPTIIEDDVWVGYGAILVAGVRLGRGSIIAAGAVVTKNVPEYEIHGGIPARKIGDRFSRMEDRKAHDEMLRNRSASPKFAR